VRHATPETSAPHHNSVRRLIEKFLDTGSMLGTEPYGRPSKRKDKKFMGVSDAMLPSPSKSLLKLCLVAWCLAISDSHAPRH
jgi:hypothetical protein